MDQDDFRNLLKVGSTASSSLSSSTKRSRDAAFSGKDTRRAAAFLAPRHVKRATNPFTQQPNVSIASDAIKRARPTKSLLAEGYTDRAKTRLLQTNTTTTSAENDKEQAILDLKDQLSRKVISHKAYLEATQAFGTGDVESSGMVRGLDKKLLQRVRDGEDVFAKPVDQDEAEEALDQALLNSSSSSRSVKAATTSRDTVLAAFQNKFKPVVKTNPDGGTTTETIEEGGKKVKIIRDSSGQIVKKLVKKSKCVAPSPIVEQPPRELVSSVRETQTEAIMEQDELDIFEDAGTDYDPLSALESSHLSKSTAEPSGARNYFGSSVHSEAVDPDPLVPTSAEEFLRQNRDALTKASSIVDRQTKVDLEKLAAKNAKDAGFGLVFRDGDAYAADLREVPEDDEMYQKKQRGKSQTKEKDP